MSDFYNFFHQANFNVLEANYMEIGKEWKSMVNEFKHVRIYYIRSGSAELTLTNQTITLEEGYLYFIPAFSVLEGNCKSNMGHYFIHMAPDIFTEHFFKMLLLKNRRPLSREIADYLFLKIIKSSENDSFYSRQASDSALKLLFTNFFEGTKIEETNIGKFTKAFEYIDAHLGEKIYIKDLSKLVCLDDKYFSNIFKQTFGTSVQQHILNKRADRAKELLATDVTIAEISNALGFFDPASFTNFFKKQVGLSPKQFRSKFFKNISR